MREKNWKAMDALSEMEKNLNNKIKTAVQSVKVYLVQIWQILWEGPRFQLHRDPGG